MMQVNIGERHRAGGSTKSLHISLFQFWFKISNIEALRGNNLNYQIVATEGF